MSSYRLAIALATAILSAHAQPNPVIQKIVAEVSTTHIAATIKKLTAFETRGNLTDPTSETRGIGAARRWIHSQLTSYSPRLEVSFDTWKVKKQGDRILRDVDMVNVVAVLPGTTQADRRVVVSGHYDSINMLPKPGFEDYRSRPDGSTTMVDFEKSMDLPAPGASDDASGVAVVMELARVMSQYRFEKTIVFIAFAGEEFGTIGSRLYAERAKKQTEHIEALLNNDIVGNDESGAGRTENGFVHVFSADPSDSLSRELARYTRQAAQRYIPGFRAELVFRGDRFGRNGDQTPFASNGFAAVRFTTPAENQQAQHTSNDTFEKSSPDYTARVARVNAATLASLALAPPPPDVFRELTTGENKGSKSPSIGRGKTLSDAVLRWSAPKPVDDLAGYTIVIRPTTSPYWDREIFAGKVNEYTLHGLSIDDVAIGIKAVDTDGNESLVSSYSTPSPKPAPTPKPIQLQDDK